MSGNYWGTFQIEILISTSYPYCVPLLYEKSEVIPRHIDYHIDQDGCCCVDIGHKLSYRAKSGISVLSFLSYWVYPFFANQLYRIQEKHYANGEYAHRFIGVKQFYLEDLALTSDAAVNVLQALLSKKGIGRNDLCPCGSGKKLKRCHLYGLEFLKTLGPAIWQSDLRNFINS